MKPVTYFGAPENTTIEISQESFRSIVGQIEAELHCSEIYSRVLASLQTMLGEAASSAEILIKAVSREAVRLAFQRVPKPKKLAIQAVEDSGEVTVISNRSRVSNRPVPPPPPLPVSIMYQRTLEDGSNRTISQPSAGNDEGDIGTSQKSNKSPQEELPEVAHPISLGLVAPNITDNNNLPVIMPGLPKKKRLSPVEKAALAVQAREDRLREIGLELRKARQVRSLSLQQVYSQTLVPLHHLESLEKGLIEKLPEDIYTRGFIRRLGNALGLDGKAMADSLPKPEMNKTMVPSWYLSETEPVGFDLRPVHLYVGYTALMAGAVGGIAWLSQQPIPGATVVPQKAIPSPASVSPAKKHQAPTPKPGVKKSSTGSIIMGGDMSPPEMIFA